MDYIYLIAGLAVMVFGAEMLVRNASTLATRLGIPSLIVGLTIVAFGTSAPELAISSMASLDGKPDLALGNVIGSNIFNVLLILGVSALVTPLIISEQLVRIDVPFMIGVSALAMLMALDGNIGHFDGLLLLAALVTYTMFQIVQGKKSAAADEALQPPKGHLVLDVALLLVGLGILVVGSRLFLDGAVGIARAIGLSELVIGLTIVAIGTSLPEAATSVVAALRGERDIAVGNVVGSNVFNILAVLGVASLLSGQGISIARSSVVFDFPVMIAVAVACLPVFFKQNTIARWQGGVFVGYYAAYMAYLILRAQEHDALNLYGTVIVYFAFPLTLLTFGAIAWQRLQAR